MGKAPFPKRIKLRDLHIKTTQMDYSERICFNLQGQLPASVEKEPENHSFQGFSGGLGDRVGRTASWLFPTNHMERQTHTLPTFSKRYLVPAAPPAKWQECCLDLVQPRQSQQSASFRVNEVVGHRRLPLGRQNAMGVVRKNTLFG